MKELFLSIIVGIIAFILVFTAISFAQTNLPMNSAALQITSVAGTVIAVVIGFVSALITHAEIN